MKARSVLLWDLERSHPLYFLLVVIVLVALFAGDAGPENEAPVIVVRRVGKDSYIVAFDPKAARPDTQLADKALVEAADDLKRRAGLVSTTPLYADGTLEAILVTGPAGEPSAPPRRL